MANTGISSSVGTSSINSVPSLNATTTSLNLFSNKSSLASTGSISNSFSDNNQVLSKQRLQDLVREVDPNEQLDDDVEEMLLQIADDFIENVVTNSCLLAKHRKANTLEVKDVQLNLERNWNLWIPGFGSDELRPYKKSCVTEAHKQKMALIKKTLKKY
ncbi:Transcription initiation factor TFIID subunit 12 [Chamberlinius hualienensis]